MWVTRRAAAVEAPAGEAALWPFDDCCSPKSFEVATQPLPRTRSRCGVRLDSVASFWLRRSCLCLCSRAELVLDYRFTRSLADRPSPRPIAPFIPAPETAAGL